MACDDWKREQDAARGQWVERRRQQCAEERDQGYSKCTEERDQGYSKCTEERDQGYSKCTEERDQGYSKCTEERDQGYNQCCDWWPCSWGCKAWVWVSNVVCVAWTWVKNIVCVAWTWVKNIVCVAWTWVKNIVCVAWTWVVDKVWLATTAVAWGICKVWDWATRWARSPLDIVDDSVPDLAGFNFDRKDEAGNVIPFLWGVSTAAFQVEGGIENNDWHQFTHTPSVRDRVAKLGSMGGTTLQIESEGQAVDHWDLEVLKEDLDRAQLLGLNAYRFSLEWARIQPDKPAWADVVIAKRKEARDALTMASTERSIASIERNRD